MESTHIGSVILIECCYCWSAYPQIGPGAVKGAASHTNRSTLREARHEPDLVAWVISSLGVWLVNKQAVHRDGRAVEAAAASSSRN